MLRSKKDEIGGKTSAANVQPEGGGDNPTRHGGQAVGEWTEERIGKIISNNPILCAGVIARELNKLNAALAAAETSADEFFRANGILTQQLAAEREVGHNTAVALAQQITKLEDQVQTLRDTLKLISRYCDGLVAKEWADAALAKVEENEIPK